MIKNKLTETEKLRLRMDYKFSTVDEKFEEVIEKIEGTDKKIDRVLTQLDSMAGQFKKFDEELMMQSGRITIHSDQIKELQGVVFPNA
ncbi:hypothetical protein A2422_00925 [Candidatus Woesebacteria bacterium RIFOXYC1_FULL_31_51]|uniref:Uncharacterized protein n=1 Tax=Candidatus Woesebacteria bacterium GW2011_GWC2_31_9 TaxID=1618586 RepID=A0A0F9YJI6_9BACT|nr:MAG: hypothetical protein UR17_C0001G0634 [Candidatus Woesebacteria bacterium GW2011_GWF1_31_35]KKP22752.1 MAG: hypothetical protein UR11_C0002G0132 [Candidatus Woesebacteria bacterium GW2011_GWC1_30_29]KKP25865.1 MAG: hypothetical protein UR13_C0006G0004 [Candidatus Woesebacteria bacterium GW2011_GWD1_31_12]KKP28000.1 MAG: hypothetical protein UR16_C0001G0021 [Candidatus Woesebacteria bacterium GW2011_GWB1_31_29]KKP30442.1 MAG: hypothetical protein UR20_C0055G0008 [Candidatus Woesebacteria 